MTSNSLTGLAVAAVLGGACGGGVVWLLAGSAKTPPPAVQAPPERPKDVPTEQDDSTGERLDHLEDQLSNLRRDLLSRRALVDYAKALGDSEEESPDAKPKRIVDAEDPAFELAVRTVLDRAEWEREEERRVRQQQRGIERAERQTEMLTEELKLDQAQRGEVRTILTEQMSRFRELRGSDDPGTPRPVSRQEWAERIAAVRSQTEERLGKVLAPDQLNAYQQIMQEERERRWGPGRSERRWSGTSESPTARPSPSR